jgi:hypothetical protein
MIMMLMKLRKIMQIFMRKMIKEGHLKVKEMILKTIWNSKYKVEI